MPACQLIPAKSGFVSGMLGYFDCQAQAIGAGGYQSLAAPGSTAQIVLTAMLTLFVAVFGFRLLFGETLGARDGVTAITRIGIVLALAGSWPAYQTLIYDVVLRAPAQLASDIGTPGDLPGASGGLPARLDGVNTSFEQLSIAGVGVAPFGQSLATRPAPPPFIGFDTFALGMAQFVFLVSAIASFAVVRLLAGILLALGPLFIAFLLFDGTRGLFEGWLRGLIGSALGALAAGLVLGVELTLLEPWLFDLLAQRAAEQPITGAPAQLLAVSGVFALSLLALLIATARLATGLRLSRSWRHAAPPSERRRALVIAAAGRSGTTATIPEERTRAATIVDAVSASQRREAGYGATTFSGGTKGSGRNSTANTSTTVFTPAAIPFGRTGSGRRTATRASAGATKRDRRS